MNVFAKTAQEEADGAVKRIHDMAQEPFKDANDAKKLISGLLS